MTPDELRAEQIDGLLHEHEGGRIGDARFLAEYLQETSGGGILEGNAPEELDLLATG